MRAAVLDELGPDAAFRIAEVPTPTPLAGQVRVRVEAIGVNPVDVGTRSGLVPLSPPVRFPLILGWDVAGVVDAVGDGVTEWVLGDAVMGFSAHLTTRVGTYAQYVVLDAGDVARQPSTVSPGEAATLPSSGLTALQALDAAQVTGGDHLVVVGAAGMVGGLVTEVAAARGARVIAVVSAPDADVARRLGAVDVVHRGDDVARRIREFAPRGADVAINAARDGGQVAMDALRDGARFVAVAGAPPPQRGITPGEVLVHSDRTHLRELSRMASNGTVTPRVSRTLRLDQADLAHQLVLAGGLAGKVILQPG